MSKVNNTFEEEEDDIMPNDGLDNLADQFLANMPPPENDLKKDDDFSSSDNSNNDKDLDA